MPMRRDCRHYFRRSAAGGDGTEGCSLDAAPDAPQACPANCTWFEKRQLSTAGFVYGSLAPEPAEAGAAEAHVGLDDASRAALDDVASFMDEIGDAVVSDERRRRRRAGARQPWWKRIF
ncbi:MAG: hypothetical protein IT198_09720 [Acidimicrobiia bacterium]|nr:hypothetical protein [Acidimicrobiia bacterium]